MCTHLTQQTWNIITVWREFLHFLCLHFYHTVFSKPAKKCASNYSDIHFPFNTGRFETLSLCDASFYISFVCTFTVRFCQNLRKSSKSNHSDTHFPTPSPSLHTLFIVATHTLWRALFKYAQEAGVLRKLSLAGLAQLSRLRNCWLRFGLASAGCRGLGVHDRPVYTAG